MVSEKKWFAIYTRSRSEKKVSGLLDQKKISNYCPLNRVIHQWKDRKKMVEEPLFSGYVFVYISTDEITTVKETPGVINFVYWLNKPAEIKKEEIKVIKDFLTEYSNVQVQRIAVNDFVRVVNGPMKEFEGNVINVTKHSVKVYLESLQYFMTVEINIDDVKTIKKTIKTT
ncbi:MAG: UpxY family transcription antiterminator [Bacteroidota bacterium]